MVAADFLFAYFENKVGVRNLLEFSKKLTFEIAGNDLLMIVSNCIFEKIFSARDFIYANGMISVLYLEM